MKNKLLFVLPAILAALFLSSCAGWTFELRTPYGDATSAKGGTVIVAPKPLVIPQK